MTVTPDGRIKLHPTSVKAAGVPAAGLMKWFRRELDSLITSNRARGVEITGNEYVLLPDRLIPEPRVSGRQPASASQPIARGSFGRRIRAAVGQRCEELHVLPRRRLEVREADDDRHRPAAHRRRPARPVRVLRRRGTSRSWRPGIPRACRTAGCIIHAGPRPGVALGFPPCRCARLRFLADLEWPRSTPGRARGSAVEHSLHTRGVGGSIPPAPTNLTT